MKAAAGAPKKYTVAEFHHYHDAFVRKEQQTAQTTLTQTWDAFFIDSGWSFENVINFLNSAADDRKQHDMVLNVISGMALANGAWRHWFFMDFPHYARDLMMDPAQAEPFPWVMHTMDAYKQGRTSTTDVDAQFRNVPWRVAYYWCRLFDRQCAKYLADIMLTHYEAHVEMHRRYPHYYGSKLEDPTHVQLSKIKRPRDNVHITGGPIRTEIVISDDDDDASPVVNAVRWLTGDSFWGLQAVLAPKSMPFLCFLAYRRHVFWLDSRDIAKVYGDRPSITQDDIPNLGYYWPKGTGQNFDPKHVESFIRWYMHELVTRNPLFQKAVSKQYWGGQHVLGDTVLHHRHRDGPEKENTTLDRAAIALGVYKDGDWPLLDRLPLCPTIQFEPRGPEYEYLGVIIAQSK